MRQEMGTICLGTEEVVYVLERKKVKNLNLRVYRNGEIRISANSRVKKAEIERFLKENRERIAEMRKRVMEKTPYRLYPSVMCDGARFWLWGQSCRVQWQEGCREEAVLAQDVLRIAMPRMTEQGAERLFEKWAKTQERYLVQIVQEMFAEYGFPGECPTVKVRRMKRSWGNCRKEQRVITLNRELLAAPTEGVRYVVLHELCHLLEANHSARFYQEVEKRMPAWKQMAEALYY